MTRWGSQVQILYRALSFKIGLVRLSPVKLPVFPPAALACALIVLSGCQAPPSGPAPGDLPAPDSGTASFLPQDSALQPSEAPANAPPRPPLSSPEHPEDFARWERDPARAKRKSELLHRPLLILFTGLSWSANARKLGEEVFLSKSFNALARERLTLLYLDFPQNARDAPQTLQYFKEYYKVQGLPSVVILNEDGTVGFRKTGYVPGKAQDYFNELKTAVESLAKPD